MMQASHSYLWSIVTVWEMDPEILKIILSLFMKMILCVEVLSGSGATMQYIRVKIKTVKICTTMVEIMEKVYMI